MHTLWFVTNPKSGTTTPETCAAIEAGIAAAGLVLGGRTDFPEQSLPTIADLTAAGVDTVVLYAGDGTVNATLCALEAWDGAFLILPGGTMNMLAKLLHDTLDPQAIIATAATSGVRTAVPLVSAAAHRAFVGLNLGPAASWFHAREAVREGQLAKLRRLIRLAWLRTFQGKVRIAGLPHVRKGYQAVLITPSVKGLDVAAVDARDWGSIVQIGWEWLGGDWLKADAVTNVITPSLRTLGRKPTLGLFDGEPVILPRGTLIESGVSRDMFIATKAIP